MNDLFVEKANQIYIAMPMYNLIEYSDNYSIAVPLKYLSNFWISLETLLINCKVFLESNWIEE